MRTGLFAVADGMGGHRAGEVASATAIETLPGPPAPAARPLDQAAGAANRAVFEQASGNAGHARHGHHPVRLWRSSS